MATDELITIKPASYPPIAALIRARGEPCRGGLVRMTLAEWRPLRAQWLAMAAERTPRGLGDTVACLLGLLPFIRLLRRKGCAKCQRRQHWLNRVFPYPMRRTRHA
jgi:hypothetical protein